MLYYKNIDSQSESILQQNAQAFKAANDKIAAHSYRYSYVFGANEL